MASREKKNDLFLDASLAIALSIESDERHLRAMELSQQVEKAERSIVTTAAVLLEIGNILASERYRSGAAIIVRETLEDPDIVVVDVDNELFARGLEHFEQHSDKTWGLVDCISFVVMRERGITEALTADRHFVQAGFRALLLEDG